MSLWLCLMELALSEDEEMKMMMIEGACWIQSAPSGSSQSVYMDGEQTSWSRKTSDVGVRCQKYTF